MTMIGEIITIIKGEKITIVTGEIITLITGEIITITSWDWAGPSSAQAGIRLYFNFLQIWFLPIWIDRIGFIKKIWFGIFGL